MALAQTVKVDGLKEIEGSLKILREQFGVKTGGIIIRALREGAKLVRDDARKRAPQVPSGYAPAEFHRRIKGDPNRYRYKKVKTTAANRRALLVENIVEHAIPVKDPRSNGRPTVLVRVRAHGYTREGGSLRFTRPHSSPSWWWWLEFGTSKRAATPFMRPAFEAQKYAALEKFRVRAAAEVDNLLKIKRSA